MSRLTETKTVIGILDKMNFFQGQRAGRELWNDKTHHVQEQDLENFKRDINTIGDYIFKVEKELKQYRDLEEQGLLLRLPCKVGDKVYLNNYGVVVGDTLEAIETNEKGFLLWGRESLLLGYFGETVFLTKEEAEAALAKMKEGV